MARGRYERRDPNREMRIRVILVLAALLVTLAIILVCCNPVETPMPTDPTVTPPQTTEAPTTVTETPTTAPTVAPTAPPTEPTAEPTAPPTEPATEPPTEPTAEPTEAPTTEPTEYVAHVSSVGDDVAETALGLVGTAYEFGGVGPDTFDISGLVFYCFQQNGIDVPREFGGQMVYGEEVPADQLMPGDVIFFWSTTPGEYEYVGIYVGDRQFVAARNPEKPTSLMNLDNEYFAERYISARRYFK